jgi:pyruvate dehydrogenase E2 component (dihydrolipoamide acetyltransferase)
MPKLRAFTMPKWGIEMVEGTVSKWSVNEGESVKKGATIVLIETDKIVNEVEAESDTTFVRILAGPGDTVPVGALLGVMADGAASTAEVDASPWRRSRRRRRARYLTSPSVRRRWRLRRSLPWN